MFKSQCEIKMGNLKVAITGLEKFTSSLVQGFYFYANADEETSVSGLMHVKFGDYQISDVKVVCAFEVNTKKIEDSKSKLLVKEFIQSKITN